MQNINPYESTLSEFYYDELLDLYQEAVANGDYADNTLSASTQIAALKAASVSFSSVPLPSAGNVATDDSFNNPVALLTAQTSAISSEISAFSAVIAAYTSLIIKETTLLDKLLAGANLEISKRKYLTIQTANTYAWDFRIDPGLIDDSLDTTDPSTNVEYTSVINTQQSYSLDGSQERSGLQPALPTATVSIEDLTWLFTNLGQNQSLTGPDWATLSILDDNPLITYNNLPSISVLLPNNGNSTGVFAFTGTATSGTPDIYVQTQFIPRFNLNNTLKSAATSNLCTDPNFSNSTWTLNSWVHDTSETLIIGQSSVAKSTVGCGVLTSPAISGSLPNQELYVLFNVQNSSDADGIIQGNVIFLDNTGTQVGAPVPVRMAQPILGEQIVDGLVPVPDNSSITQARLLISLTGNTAGKWFVYGVNIQGPQLLSNWVVDPDSVTLFSLDSLGNPNIVYTQNVDYVVTPANSIVLLNIVDSAYGFGAQFSEYYPAYSCSMDNKTWSSVIMLDPARIYPDSTTAFVPIAMGGPQRNQFPITDELGNPSGIYMTMPGIPQYSYVLQIGVGASSSYGLTASLQIDLGKTSYISAISLSPLSSYPVTLTKVQVVGLAINNPSTVFTGTLLMDKPTQLTFPRQVGRSIILTFTQANYNIKTHAVDAPDSLRRNILTQLQNSIPFADQWNIPAEIDYYSGAQYDMGFDNIQVYDLANDFPQVVIAGPIRFNSPIDILRFDAETTGDVGFYLCYRTFSASGQQIDQNLTGLAITAGSATVFPYASGVKANTAYIDVSIKYVLRNLAASVSLFNIQAVPNA